ncbi:hypothetical protein B0H16DRAFT_1721702 [Mycena metata]|uniref:Uncharacterized protein n=1 Tax=Mycena metata TaxID=1033252 RepID=A0AAD7J463_9AGAR|nr:hypothetical protein B0H16DRAFT_1721702 [Mycena metata]
MLFRDYSAPSPKRDQASPFVPAYRQPPPALPRSAVVRRSLARSTRRPQHEPGTSSFPQDPSPPSPMSSSPYVLHGHRCFRISTPRARRLPPPRPPPSCAGVKNPAPKLAVPLAAVAL